MTFRLIEQEDCDSRRQPASQWEQLKCTEKTDIHVMEAQLLFEYGGWAG